jgi:branched-chain amino acid transport system ATP-binding protein
MSIVALLEVLNISQEFGGLRALSDFSLFLAEGSLVGLIGPNGAGKTTVFNVITGVYRPTTGRIVFDGKDITGWPSYRIMAAGLGRTFQNIRLFKDMTALDNIRLGAFAHYDYSFFQIICRTPFFRWREQEITDRAMEMLERFGLSRYAQTPARNLPYGEQRRLEIARALISRPRVLLLDEPAAGMNQAETAALVELLREIRREFQLTILLIEHHMGVVLDLCQQVHVLDFGSSIFAGPPQEAQQDPQVLEAYLGRDEEEQEGEE